MTFNITALRRALVAVALTVLCTTLLTAPNNAASAQTAVQDPERNASTVTNWGWHTNVSAATVNNFVATGYRITDIEVNAATPTFSATYVRNSGVYARSWWWYYGKTGSQVSSLLSTNGARLIDIEPYATANGTRFAVVMVKNSGVAAKGWGWHYNATVSSIGTYAANNNMRVIDVDRYSTSSGVRFTAIYIKNTGVDAKGWWHYYNVSSAQVSSFLSANNARLIDLERLSNGNYDVVMQSTSGYWWWLLGLTSTQLKNAAGKLGARIYKIEPYVVGGVRRYNALLINNVNSETTRIRNLVSAQMTGPWGFYLKKVGGSDLLGIAQDNVFEPASMIKIVHGVTAMRDIQLNTTTKDTLRTWYAHPSFPARYPESTGYRTASTSDTDHADVCAYNGDTGNLLTGATYSDKLGPVLIKQTLVYSDNRTTDALTRRYGFSGLNNTASLAGMTSSKVNHRIGCPSKASPQPVTHNRLTLRDAGRIYEKVQNLTLLNAAHRDLLYSYMGGGVIGDGGLKTMILDEAVDAGLTLAERNSFVANVVTRSKGGSYGYCPNFDGSGTCNPPTVHSRTVGGVIWLPFKGSSGIIAKTPYVYGRYWDAQLNCTWASVTAGSCTSFNNNNSGMGTVSVEMFRAEVKKALATW
jgi:hypothetical protein